MFRITNDMRNYFKHIKNNDYRVIETDFDIFYLCTIIGIINNKKYENGNSEVFSKVVIQKYSDGKYDKLLLSFLQSEIEYHGIDVHNRHDIKNLCNKLIDSNSSTKLTNTGIDLLNQYCMGGFEIIKENVFDIYNPTVFLDEYMDLVL